MKIIILTVAIIALIIIGVSFSAFLDQDSQVFSDNKLVEENNLNNSPLDGLSASQDGVDVEVKNIIKEDGKTFIELSYSNHVYDLASMDASIGSSLAGVSPIEYNILNSAMGGHHAEAMMIFEGDLSGELIVGLNESLIFKFNI